MAFKGGAQPEKKAQNEFPREDSLYACAENETEHGGVLGALPPIFWRCALHFPHAFAARIIIFVGNRALCTCGARELKRFAHGPQEEQLRRLPAVKI